MLRAADYVIAGGGTAGAVIAKRLAEGGAEVILIEAGPSGETDDRVNVLARWPELLGSELDYDYMTESAAGNDLMRYPQARVLGGCSAHNGAIAFRAPDWDLDAWEQLGASGWGAKDSAPFFERLLAQVPLELADGNHEWVDAFIAAAGEAGLPPVDMGQPNVREGAGRFMQNRIGDRRASSAAAYLFPLTECPANLEIITDETVLRLLIDQRGDALGVETARGKVFAREEVVLCGGTFGSPKLLLLSGIGPGDHLGAIGIDQVAELPGVGRHLIDHPEGLILWEATGPPQGSSRSHWESGAFLGMPDGADFPEIQVQMVTMRYDEVPLARGYPRGEHIFAALPNVTRARSEGFVQLRSPDPSAPLQIDTGYFTDPEGYDERVMLEGMRWTRALAEQPALSRFIKRELVPGPGVSDDAGLIECARTVGDSVIHPTGTCKMGAEDDPMAVVGPRLRVRGVGRLRVADASVFPAMTTVNPCLTVMMIGERCSAEILRE